jgi:hypothetical protein
MVRIEAIFIGEPKNITDGKGTWLSAIYRSWQIVRAEGLAEEWRYRLGQAQSLRDKLEANR